MPGSDSPFQIKTLQLESVLSALTVLTADFLQKHEAWCLVSINQKYSNREIEAINSYWPGTLESCSSLVISNTREDFNVDT